ncbi:MAG: hypothetical protein GF390_01920 [Candidatus Pacebacteria bacterium]|nr:hypothetical protein [Candidatus Paceibacterota bacterium]
MFGDNYSPKPPHWFYFGQLFWVTVFIALLVFCFLTRVAAFAKFQSSVTLTNNIIQVGQWQQPNQALTQPLLSWWLIGPSQHYFLHNWLINSSFEQDLLGWQTTGQVQVVTPDQTSTAHPVPLVGQKMVQLSALNSNQSLLNNTLSQQLANDQPLYNLSFWYYLLSEEAALGFDEPAFIVQVNGQLVYQVWAQDLAKPGWQQVILNLTDLDARQAQLQFAAGNTGDQLFAPVVYLDQITTNLAVLNNHNSLQLRTDECASCQLGYQYFIDGQSFDKQGFSPLELQLNGAVDDHQLQYWFVNDAGESQDSAWLTVWFDDQPPQSIENLEFIPESDQQATLMFTAPADQFSWSSQTLTAQVNRYQLRWSDQQFFDQHNWEQAQVVQFFTDQGLSFKNQAPRLPGQLEKLILTNLPNLDDYFLAIRAQDAAGNWSAIKEIHVSKTD